VWGGQGANDRGWRKMCIWELQNRYYSVDIARANGHREENRQACATDGRGSEGIENVRRNFWED